MTIRLIGLGVMGGHMARHLSGAYEVVVFDVDPTKVAAVANTCPADSVAEVAQQSDVVLLSRPSTQIVEAVTTGARNQQAGLRARRYNRSALQGHWLCTLPRAEQQCANAHHCAERRGSEGGPRFRQERQGVAYYH